MRKWIVSLSASALTVGLTLGMSTAAWAECVQDSNGTIYNCGGSPEWNFETGKWTCVAANGQTVSGDKSTCTPGGGPDAGTDDLLEPLVPRGKNRAIPPGDRRKRMEQPK